MKFSFKKTAFTLVELLVAVAVIAVGMVFVLGAFSQCMFSAITAEKMETATYLLNSKIWEIDIAQQLNNGSEEGLWSGKFEKPYQDFSWSDIVRGISADFGEETEFVAGNLSEEILNISWKQGKAVKDLSVMRYVRKKKSSD